MISTFENLCLELKKESFIQKIKNVLPVKVDELIMVFMLKNAILVKEREKRGILYMDALLIAIHAKGMETFRRNFANFVEEKESLIVRCKRS